MRGSDAIELKKGESGEIIIFLYFCNMQSLPTLYPLLFEPNLHEAVWGGHYLTNWKQLPHTETPIGESWEVSGIPNCSSIVANGPLAGKTLNEVIATYKGQVLGEAVYKNFDGQMPLLIKFIDAQEDLSIQVHPDDEMAKAVHGKMGKNEMWYVIKTEPGACIYSGFAQEITPYELRQRIADGSLTEVIARHEAQPGDVFFIPAGRIHAIGKGILLAEVQQSSDLTYRIFDYNRLGMDGEPRELHVDLAQQALNYKVDSQYRTRYEEKNNSATLVIDSNFFNVRVVNFDAPIHRDLIKYDSFFATMAIQGDSYIRLRSTGEQILLREGSTCLLPAAVADCDIIPAKSGVSNKILDAFINNEYNPIKTFFKQIVK